MSDRSRLTLALIILGSGVLGFLMLNRGQDWGDDFAAYILQAQSVVDGNMEEALRRSAFTMAQSSWRFGPITFPWGFPLLLAPVYALVGTKVLAFKLLLTLCYVAFLPIYYRLCRTRLNDTEALLLTAFMAFNLGMLRAQNRILSDLPFLLWSTTAVWLIEVQRIQRPGTTRALLGAAATGLAVSAAWMTRPNGFLLFLPLLLVQVMVFWRRARMGQLPGNQVAQALIPYAISAAALLAQRLFLPSSTLGLRDQWQTLSWMSIAGNMIFYARLPGDFLSSSISGGYLLYGVFVAGALVTAVSRWRHELPILLYVVSTIALFIIFPLRQGQRYIYPILPLFFLLAMQGMKIATAALPARMQRAAAISLLCIWLVPTVLSLGFGIHAAWMNLSVGRQPPAGPYEPAAADMFSFIRHATPQDSVVIFRKPRAMRLLTDRDAFLTTDCDDLPMADYVVIVKEGDTKFQISPSRIGSCNPNVELTRKYGRGGFEVFEIDPAH
jgi:hypothetical protein